MHARLRKKPVWISLVIILLASTLTISIPSSASKPDTVLSVDPPTTVDKTKTPGETFSINIGVTSVVNMWGYKFLLSYDTNVLTATSFSSSPIFSVQEPSKIDDDPTVTDEEVGTGTGCLTEFDLPLSPVRRDTDITVYFALANESVGTGDGTTEVFELDHSPVKSGTGTVYLSVTDETVGTGDGTTEEFLLAHFPVRTGTVKVYLSVTDETVGTGDGTTEVFELDHSPVKSGTDTVYLGEDEQVRDVDYSIDYETGDVTFTTAPASGVPVTADYTYIEIEDHYRIAQDDRTLAFYSSYVPESGVVITADYFYVASRNIDYTIDYATGEITFTTAPEDETVIEADYTYIIPDVAYTVDYDAGKITFETAPEKGIVILADYIPEAYVQMAFHMPFGVSQGFTGSLPNLATIQFTVDDYGWSPLDLHDTVFSDPYGAPIEHEDVDGYFANVIHDVAITAVTPSPTEVTKPTPVYIDVTVLNEGDLTETFAVTAYYDDTAIDVQSVTDLVAGASKILTFTWDTTPVSLRTYTISATATAVPGEPETALDDNMCTDGTVTVEKLAGYPSANFTYLPKAPLKGENVTFDASLSSPDGGEIFSYEWNFGDDTTEIYVKDKNLTHLTTHAYDTIGTYTVILNVTDTGNFSDLCMDTVTVYRHDVAVVCVIPDPAEQTVGQPVKIDVTVVNEGNFTETFAVTAYYDDTAIDVQSVTDLVAGASIPLSYDWDTTDATPGNYTIKAVADIVPGECPIDTDDNTYVDGEVTILPRLEHNIAVTDAVVAPVEVPAGGIVSVNVTVKNKGVYYETFKVYLYYVYGSITEPIEMKQGSLEVGANKTVSFTWNTTDVIPGDYLIRALAQLPPETDEPHDEDNKLDGGTVTVLGVWHDIAINKVTADPTKVALGQSVTIEVTVKNEGTSSETFNVTVCYDSILIETRTDVTLSAGKSTTLTFTWLTTDVVEGKYTIRAEAIVDVDDDPDDNAKEYALDVNVGHHDTAVTNVTVSPTEVLVGESIFINITVKNQGIFIETFNVTIKYDGTTIETKNVTNLSAGASITLNFTWDTAGVSASVYVINATASIAPHETKRADNMLLSDPIAVRAPVVTSTLTISASPANITVGETTTINGSITPTRVAATATIWFRMNGGTWDVLAIVITNENGQYSYDWKYATAGTYEVKASWGGDASTLDAESDLQNITVEGTSGSDFVLYAVAGGAIIIGVVIVYFLRFRKSKTI